MVQIYQTVSRSLCKDLFAINSLTDKGSQKFWLYHAPVTFDEDQFQQTIECKTNSEYTQFGRHGLINI